MESYVFIVSDYISSYKSLQLEFIPINIPWILAKSNT